VQKLPQYRGLIAPWAKSLMTRSQIPMDRRFREIGDLKPLSMKPLVQVSKETEL
jgi:hypothetical protein